MKTKKEDIKTTVMLKVKPGNVDKLVDHVKSTLQDTLSEPGCISAKTYQNEDDPNMILFIEEWASVENFNNHMNSEQVGNMDDFVPEIADGEPVFGIWKRIV